MLIPIILIVCVILFILALMLPQPCDNCGTHATYMHDNDRVCQKCHLYK